LPERRAFVPVKADLLKVYANGGEAPIYRHQELFGCEYFGYCAALGLMEVGVSKPDMWTSSDEASQS
jgi:hypothetical protein